MRPVKTFTAAQFPQSRSDLHVWIHEHLKLSQKLEPALFAAVDAVFTRHQALWEEAIQALSAGFADKMAHLQVELSAKDTTVSSIACYFEQLVADLTEFALSGSGSRMASSSLGSIEQGGC